jgi:hypothetical protein
MLKVEEKKQEGHRILQERTGNRWKCRQYSDRKFSAFFSRWILAGTGPYFLTWALLFLCLF